MFFQDTYFPQARDPVVGVEPFLIEDSLSLKV